METSYIGGPGVLLARSRRWLLLDDDPSLPSASTSGGRCWAPPVRSATGWSPRSRWPTRCTTASLVLVDLDDPDRGHLACDGRVDVEGARRTLSVGLTGFGSARPLLAGVVPAASVEIDLPDPQPLGTELIDGIPDEILATTSSGPSTRPYFRPAGSYRTDDDEEDEAAITVPRASSPTCSAGLPAAARRPGTTPRRSTAPG